MVQAIFVYRKTVLGESQIIEQMLKREPPAVRSPIGECVLRQPASLAVSSGRKLPADLRPHRNHLRTFEKGELDSAEFIRVRQQPPTEPFRLSQSQLREDKKAGSEPRQSLISARGR